MRRTVFAAIFSLGFSCLLASDLDQAFQNRIAEQLNKPFPCRYIPFKDHTATELFSDGEWRFYDWNAGAAFLNLDNTSIASVDDIALDPFLAIRTKLFTKGSKVDIIRSLEYVAHFDILNRKFQEETIISPEELQSLIKPVENFQVGSARLISIANEGNAFTANELEFTIGGLDSQCERICWQISDSANFSTIHPLSPNLEGIQEGTGPISLDMLTGTFFNPKKNYYFRAKVKDKEGWTVWSNPYAFKVMKPAQIQNSKIEGELSTGYRLKWESPKAKNVRFHVFASNALDFIPSIYSDKQINAMINGEATACEPNENLIAITTKNELKIDQKFAYYRVIAECDGVYSVPSPIIRFFDEDVKLSRTVLQATDECVQRVALPTMQTQKGDFFSTEERVVRPSGISDDIWNRVSPYLMPDNHPVKERLDRIFTSSRAIASKDAMYDAGFKDIHTGPFSHVTIARHKRLKGYLVKLFRDDQSNLEDWEQCSRRASGAKAIRIAIAVHGYSDYMKAPKKWIYPLPDHPAAFPGHQAKHFILVVEDMDILRHKSSHYEWKSPYLPYTLIHAVATIIQEVGLNDTIHDFNMPFSKDGRIAFIDTEHHHKWPINWGILKHTLHPKPRTYLDEFLIKRGIKP